MPPKDMIEMTNKNYTNILKDCHEHIDNYINKRVKAVGYIFRAQDFNEKQFVIARDMIVNYPYDARIVGFLCESENAKEFENNTWVEITGTIRKGDYFGEIPVIKVESIRKVTTPDDVYVFPPEGFKE
jgi:putative membrane protein